MELKIKSYIYQCCYCHKSFAPEERIDGFDQGYREGFLCPKCGENLKDDLLLETKDTKENRCQNKLNILPLLFPVAMFFSVGTSINVFSMEIDLSYFVILFCIGLLLGLLVFVPCMREPTIYITKPVIKPKSTNK